MSEDIARRKGIRRERRKDGRYRVIRFQKTTTSNFSYRVFASLQNFSKLFTQLDGACVFKLYIMAAFVWLKISLLLKMEIILGQMPAEQEQQ